MVRLILESYAANKLVLYSILIFSCFSANVLSDEECSPSCSSKDCIYRANMLLNYIKPNVDPCEDFYTFACGGYMEKFGKDDTKTVYDDTWHSLQILIKDLLENLREPDENIGEKLKIMYGTCMNSESSEIKAVREATEFLNEIGISDWPNLDADFEFSEPTLSEILGRLAVYGEFSFMGFKPSPYEEQIHENSLPAPLILPDMFLLSTKLKPKDVENTVLKILAYFGVNKDASKSIWENFKSIENIGIRLQNENTGNSSKCKDGSRNASARLNCLEETETPGTMKFLCDLWKSAVKFGDLGKYYSENTIHISCGWNQYYYVENIVSNLANITERSLADYLALRFFFAHLDDLNLYFQLIKKAHSGVKDSKHRTTESITRWEYCVGWIIKSMNVALGHEYTKNILVEPIQKHILNIIQEYVDEIANDILKQTWINEKLKIYLQTQLAKLEIGFKNTMEKYKNNSFVANYYREFHPTNESFLKSILEYGRVSPIINEQDKTHFNSFFSSSDPYTMDFGVALFLPPIYTYEIPVFWNYATLGWVIGHELSHNLKLLFDVFDLDENTEKKLMEKINCYVQQYSQFLMNRIQKSKISKETEEEISADNIGWALTEKILKKYLENSTEKLNLPGVNYTPQQLMYISFTQACCEVLRKDVENELYSSNPQNVEKLRILGILQNSKMFAEIFNCSTGTVMNPENKCVFLD